MLWHDGIDWECCGATSDSSGRVVVSFIEVRCRIWCSFTLLSRFSGFLTKIVFARLRGSRRGQGSFFSFKHRQRRSSVSASFRNSDIWVFRCRGSAVVHATAQYFHCASSMGCCASKGAPEFTFGKKAEPPASAPHINLKQRRRNSVHQLTSNEKVAVQTIWDTYRTSIRMSSGQATSDDDDGTAEYEMKNKKKVMKKDGLRKILPEIDEAFFNYL